MCQVLQNASQLMGNLPSLRVNPACPFLNCGVDYAGPFIIHQSRRRSKTKVKGYAALFICLATKAIHIELISDLTTEAFLAALRRFMAEGEEVIIFTVTVQHVLRALITRSVS